LRIQRVNTAGQSGETFGDRIELYNNGGIAHAALNIVHKFGHFINVRLGGCPSAPAPSSPLGQLAAGQLKDADGSSISYYIGSVWVRGPGLNPDEPWNQNMLANPNEEMADMFLQWVYDAAKTVFQANNAGQSRRNFMNNQMTKTGGWIESLISNTFPICS
jgi:hypothetical protein